MQQQQLQVQPQQQQQSILSNQSVIVPLPVNLPGQTNFGSNIPVESPALLVNIPVTSSPIANMLVTSSIANPPSPGIYFNLINVQVKWEPINVFQ